MSIGRIIKHLFYPAWLVRRYFPPQVLEKIEAAIATSETRHGGEIRFAVESALDWRALLSEEPCRQRGIDVFSELRIWDTEKNNGVLIYLLLADHGVEIVADRGINDLTENTQWKKICENIEAAMKDGMFEKAVIEGIDEIEQLLVRHFPPIEQDKNELSNKPVILK